MITGVVTSSREAVIRLSVSGPGGREELEAAIDTGFNGFLTLPAACVSRLRLSVAGGTRAVLADGRAVHLSVFEGVVMWDGRERDVGVLEADGGPLVGMSMLDGYRLRADVADGGLVVIESLV